MFLLVSILAVSCVNYNRIRLVSSGRLAKREIKTQTETEPKITVASIDNSYHEIDVVEVDTIATSDLNCDTIFLKSGKRILAQIVEVKRKKVIYVLCCEGCAVPREVKFDKIDTIFYAPEPKTEAEHEDLPGTEDILVQNSPRVNEFKIDSPEFKAERAQKAEDDARKAKNLMLGSIFSIFATPLGLILAPLALLGIGASILLFWYGREFIYAAETSLYIIKKGKRYLRNAKILRTIWIIGLIAIVLVVTIVLLVL